MARPEESGCSYFPLDCDFFNDRKVRLLRASLSAKAETVLIRLWCAIYSDAGWYTRIDEDEITLLAENLGKGFSANYIRAVIQEACERGIFDKAVFTNFHVLTSEGVQKQYLAIKTKKRIIPIIQEYWVLNEAFFKGENESLLLKLQFFSVSAEKTAVNSEITPVIPEKTPQRKEKKKKGKEKTNSAAETAAPSVDTILDAFASGNRLRNTLFCFAKHRADMKKPLTPLAAERLCARLTKLTDEAKVSDRDGYMSAMLDKAILMGWQGVFPVDDFKDSQPVHIVPGGQDKPRIVAADADLADIL